LANVKGQNTNKAQLIVVMIVSNEHILEPKLEMTHSELKSVIDTFLGGCLRVTEINFNHIVINKAVPKKEE
jgi:hypothetical protein